MHKFFIAVHIWVNRHKVLAISSMLAFLAVAGFFASQISFEEDITRLIPKSERSDETAKVLEQLNFADKITVIISAKKGVGGEDLVQTAGVFLDSVESCKEYIKNIQGRVEDENIQETFDFVYDNLPLFLTNEDYIAIDKKLQTDSIAATVAANYRSLLSPSGMVTKDFIVKDPFGISFIALKKLQQLGMGDEFILQDGFVMTKDRQKILLFITPKLPGSETEKNTLFAERLYKIRDQINKSSVNTDVAYFGSSLIAVANAQQIKSDIKTTSIIAITALMLIFMIYYRKVYIPVIILLPTIFGVITAVALLYFLRGTISAISLSIGAVLIGVTIDYALHILTHYKHNSDIKVLYKDITRPLIMSSTTTAVAFLCLLFVNSEALKDLGIFAAVSVVVTSIFSLLIIPHLYKPSDEGEGHKKTVIDRLAGISFHNNKPVLLVCLFIIAACFFTFTKVEFNNDISQLNFIPDDIKQAEKSLEGSTSLTSKSLYAAAYGQSADAVLENNTRLQRKLSANKGNGKILGYSSVGNIVLSENDQQEKIAAWNTFWAGRKLQVKQRLITEGATIGFKPGAYEQFYGLLEKKFKPLTLQDYLNVKILALNEYITEKKGFYTVATVIRVDKNSRSNVVKELSAQPKIVAIDRQQVNETFLGGLKDDFNTLVNYSFIAVIVILFFFFRRVGLVIISCIPIVITGIVTAGIMAMFNIQLNIFSLIVCTLVFGHGVDFSIFMTSALQKEFTTGKNEMAAYRTSIILAVITTVLGIGALVFAGHPALRSLSLISLIGVLAALVITFIFYPILFRFVLTHRVNSGKAPYNLRTLLQSVISFTYYGLGGFILSIIGVIFITIFPARRHWKMKIFRYVMSKFMKSVLYSDLFIVKRTVNPNGEDFTKPAVIIANHSSFLDILAVGMLSPKIIYLVSDWVYNSPIFGVGVKLAGFYPVSQGLEGGVGHLRKKVEQGYSLMVFPEGSRSQDNLLRRFHKGAFYLAQEFQLDVLPVIIHGNAEILPKGDFILNDGIQTLQILERITPGDIRFGSDYTEKAKAVSTYFKKQYDDLRYSLEGPEYFKSKILDSYAYKEQDVIDAVNENLKLKMRAYHEFDKYTGAKNSILHYTDDHGETSLLMALQQPGRKIYSYIPDIDKRAVARTNYFLKKRKLHYPDSLDEMSGIPYLVLIIDSDDNGLLEKLIIPSVNFIIYKSGHILPIGFKQQQETEGFVILKREL